MGRGIVDAKGNVHDQIGRFAKAAGANAGRQPMIGQQITRGIAELAGQKLVETKGLKHEETGKKSYTLKRQAAAKLTPGDRVFLGKQVASKYKVVNKPQGPYEISKTEQGALGERIVAGFLKQHGLPVVGMGLTHSQKSADLFTGESLIEVKTGSAGNTSGAFKWKAGVGGVTPAERDKMAKMSPAKVKAYNKEKQKRVIPRKMALLKKLSSELNIDVHAETYAVIVHHDTKVADIYRFKGYHELLGWNSPAAKKAYIASYKYD